MIFLVAMACMIAPSSGVSSGYTSRGTTHWAAISQGDCKVWSSLGTSSTRKPAIILWKALWSSRFAADVSRLSIRKTLVKIKMTRRIANSTTRCFSFMLTSFPSPLTHSLSLINESRWCWSARRVHDYAHWSISSLERLPQFLQAQVQSKIQSEILSLPPLSLLQASNILLTFLSLQIPCLRRPNSLKLTSVGKDFIGKNQVQWRFLKQTLLF